MRSRNARAADAHAGAMTTVVVPSNAGASGRPMTGTAVPARVGTVRCSRPSAPATSVQAGCAPAPLIVTVTVDPGAYTAGVTTSAMPAPRNVKPSRVAAVRYVNA